MNKLLLDILICPKSHGKLVYNESTNELFCHKSMLAYPIENDFKRQLREVNKNKEK